jgi:uncharacterized membrane protein
MIGLDAVYALMGVLAGGVALVNLRDASNPRRYNNAAFWGLWAVTFLAGSRLPDVVSGVLVIAMVLVASVGKLGQGRANTTTAEEREASARRWGNRLFAAALVVPAVTLLGTLTLARVHVGAATLVDPKQVTLVSLGLATLVALAVALVMLRPPLRAPFWESRRLLDAVGWAAVLPQLLAALGALFALAGVGQVVSGLLGRWVPLDRPFAAVATYAIGMALFTAIMGNAFAAFPVMTAAVGLPVIVHRFGGDPAVMAAIGMLSGFCGTLTTPMAANFNVVPAALLELPDEHAVIRAQLPTALALLAVNTALMYLLVFR